MEKRTNALHVVEYGKRVKSARRCFQLIGRAVLVQYDISGPRLRMKSGAHAQSSYFVQDSSAVQEIILRCHTLNSSLSFSTYE